MALISSLNGQLTLITKTNLYTTATTTTSLLSTTIYTKNAFYTFMRRWNSKDKTKRRILLSIAVLSHLLVNVAFTTLLLNISSFNYPGGTAILRLHSLEESTEKVNVHIDVLSAQTGVSRFTQLYDNWR